MDIEVKTYKYGLDPINIFKRFKDKKLCFFLDSSYRNFGLGRYSIIGFEPFFVLRTKDKENPFLKLRELINKFNIQGINKIPFLGGAVGYFSYDLGSILERKSNPSFRNDDLFLPSSIIGFYDSGIIFDNAKKLMTAFSTGIPEKGLLAKKRARYRLKQITDNLANDIKVEVVRKVNGNIESHVESNFKKEEYLKAIKKAKDYIRKGDIYQVNLSQRFKTSCNTDSFTLYSRLRDISPNPFGAYFDFGDFQILSSSPERFLYFDGHRVVTRPMKGTRPRAKNISRDKTLRNQLIDSQKDKAELLMITDLERNDLGKVCKYSSVRVKRLRCVEDYATVFQTTSEVEGILHKDRDRVDLIKACFPGGSITGCPKIRAMQIINELEPTKRNIYTGSLGYLGFNNTMDLNIVIRTIVKKNNNVYFGVGGGIVWDSNPVKEYEETLVKAKALIQALGRKNN